MENRKGKEYHYIFGSLIIEGEFLKGKRWNGKGLQYDMIIMVFYY